jgi:hypothetical protein
MLSGVRTGHRRHVRLVDLLVAAAGAGLDVEALIGVAEADALVVADAFVGAADSTCAALLLRTMTALNASETSLAAVRARS